MFDNTVLWRIHIEKRKPGNLFLQLFERDEQLFENEK